MLESEQWLMPESRENPNMQTSEHTHQHIGGFLEPGVRGCWVLVRLLATLPQAFDDFPGVARP